MSRRAAEAAILAGRITVNGIPARLGQKIDPDADRVEYAGRSIKPPSRKKKYIMLN